MGFSDKRWGSPLPEAAPTPNGSTVGRKTSSTKPGLPLDHFSWETAFLWCCPLSQTLLMWEVCAQFPFLLLQLLSKYSWPGSLSQCSDLVSPGKQFTSCSTTVTLFGACLLKWSWKVFYCSRCHHLDRRTKRHSNNLCSQKVPWCFLLP